MHSLYARFVLRLIRPAVERISDERIAAAMRHGGALWKARVALDGARLPAKVVSGLVPPGMAPVWAGCLPTRYAKRSGGRLCVGNLRHYRKATKRILKQFHHLVPASLRMWRMLQRTFGHRHPREHAR